MNISSAKHLTPESSHLHAYQYDPKAHVLTVWFRNRQTWAYRYAGVPGEVFEALHEAERKGRFFCQHIRDVYDFALHSRDAPSALLTCNGDTRK